jgi:NTE family protein
VEIVAAPPDASELIAALPELGCPAGEQLRRLLASIEWLRVPVGRRLFTEGEPADGVYVLFEGRVRFVVESARTPLIPWEVNPVAVFGEGALLTGEGRSRTAVAVRDSFVARIPSAMFEEVMTASPEVAVDMARRVARRTVFPGVDDRRIRHNEDAISFVSPSVPTGRLEPFREVAAAALGPSGQVSAYGSDRATEMFGAVRHCDRVVVVVDASNVVDLSLLMSMVSQGIDHLAAPLLELLVIDGPDDGSDGDVRHWRPPVGFNQRLRVRDGNVADLRRIGRHVSGCSVGLVLGGGGARGLAHIGVLRALAELDIPVDEVGGSSMGAIIGGQTAMGWPWKRVYDHNRKAWKDARLRLEINFPTVSLLSGRRSRKMLEETFGEHGIEDFHLPFFCTSVDLSTFRLAVHREGSAAQWIRASASAPGLWPPVVDADGHLHVDGGQLNNVPTDVMRDSHEGPIIAVDVHASQAVMTVSPDSRPPTGLRHMFSHRSARYPGIADIFNRCALLGSLQHQEIARNYADIYLTPDLSSIGFRAFDKIEQATEIGYHAALQELSGWKPTQRADRSRFGPF